MESSTPERPARTAAGLVAGLLLMDLLLNVSAFALSAPVRSLLAPSIDVLVMVAACMAVAQAAPAARRPLRIALAVLAAGLTAASAGLRFGWDAGGHLFGSGSAMTAAAGWALCVLMIAAAAFAAFLVCGLVVRGVQPRLVRSVVLLVIALAAVLQVVSGRKLFTASVIPRLIALLG
ncbi:MAG TPA: hypothetical protein VMF68_17050 [Spirochaetia bacterium]|nr:hypothetical protein [Spirochaetia bacterium]